MHFLSLHPPPSPLPLTSLCCRVDYVSKNVLLHEKLLKVCIWDTAGNARYRQLLAPYWQRAHVAVLLYDPSSEASFATAQDWCEQIKRVSTDS